MTAVLTVIVVMGLLCAGAGLGAQPDGRRPRRARGAGHGAASDDLDEAVQQRPGARARRRALRARQGADRRGGPRRPRLRGLVLLPRRVLDRLRLADRDLGGERERLDERDPVAAPEPARVVPARGPPRGQEAHLLVGVRDQLGAVDRLERGVAPQPADEPLPRHAGGGRERAAVHPVDHADQLVLVLAGERPLELARPGALAVAVAPLPHRLVEHVQLHAALALAAPHVRQRLAELGVPQQRRQVVERDDHPDVVDRAVGEGLDRAVGERAARGTARCRRSPPWRPRRRAGSSAPGAPP